VSKGIQLEAGKTIPQGQGPNIARTFAFRVIAAIVAVASLPAALALALRRLGPN
jgi:hypothetical protein